MLWVVWSAGSDSMLAQTTEFEWDSITTDSFIHSLLYVNNFMMLSDVGWMLLIDSIQHMWWVGSGEEQRSTGWQLTTCMSGQHRKFVEPTALVEQVVNFNFSIFTFQQWILSVLRQTIFYSTFFLSCCKMERRVWSPVGSQLNHANFSLIPPGLNYPINSTQFLFWIHAALAGPLHCASLLACIMIT